MTGVSVTIDDREVFRLLNRLQLRVDDMTPVMDMIGSAMADNIRLTFHDSRDPWGRPWAPLSETTELKRLRKTTGSKSLRTKRGHTRANVMRAITSGASGKPLRDNDLLMNSITHHAGRDSVEIGTNFEYARTHQFGARKGQYGKTKRGAPIPWGDIPARPFLPIKGGNVDLPAQWRGDIIQSLIRLLTV